jgi:hypothetical protein
MDRNITCPQCANALSELLLDNGRIEEALEAANRAIRDLAQQQPHINVAYAFFHRANIWDRMCLQNNDNAAEQQTLADNACKDYMMALSLGGLPMTVSRQAKIRIEVLNAFSSTGEEPEPDIDLMELLKRMKTESDDADHS